MQATTTMPAIRTLDKRILLTGVLLALLAVSFWSGSRYPDLNRKAAVGSDMGVSGLSFDVVVQGTAHDPGWKQVAGATVNWIETNKRGMTFGLLMAAAVLTMLSLIARRGVTHPIGNSLIGVLIGAPMA